VALLLPFCKLYPVSGGLMLDCCSIPCRSGAVTTCGLICGVFSDKADISRMILRMPLRRRGTQNEHPIHRRNFSVLRSDRCGVHGGRNAPPNSKQRGDRRGGVTEAWQRRTRTNLKHKGCIARSRFWTRDCLAPPCNRPAATKFPQSTEISLNNRNGSSSRSSSAYLDRRRCVRC
jgi:hypothetical protein